MSSVSDRAALFSKPNAYVPTPEKKQPTPSMRKPPGSTPITPAIPTTTGSNAPATATTPLTATPNGVEATGSAKGDNKKDAISRKLAALSMKIDKIVSPIAADKKSFEPTPQDTPSATTTTPVVPPKGKVSDISAMFSANKTIVTPQMPNKVLPARSVTPSETRDDNRSNSDNSASSASLRSASPRSNRSNDHDDVGSANGAKRDIKGSKDTTTTTTTPAKYVIAKETLHTKSNKANTIDEDDIWGVAPEQQQQQQKAPGTVAKRRNSFAKQDNTPMIAEPAVDVPTTTSTTTSGKPAKKPSFWDEDDNDNNTATPPPLANKPSNNQSATATTTTTPATGGGAKRRNSFVKDQANNNNNNNLSSHLESEKATPPPLAAKPKPAWAMTNDPREALERESIVEPTTTTNSLISGKKAFVKETPAFLRASKDTSSNNNNNNRESLSNNNNNGNGSNSNNDSNNNGETRTRKLSNSTLAFMSGLDGKLAAGPPPPKARASITELSSVAERDNNNNNNNSNGYYDEDDENDHHHQQQHYDRNNNFSNDYSGSEAGYGSESPLRRRPQSPPPTTTTTEEGELNVQSQMSRATNTVKRRQPSIVKQKAFDLEEIAPIEAVSATTTTTTTAGGGGGKVVTTEPWEDVSDGNRTGRSDTTNGNNNNNLHNSNSNNNLNDSKNPYKNLKTTSLLFNVSDQEILTSSRLARFSAAAEDDDHRHSMSNGRLSMSTLARLSEARSNNEQQQGGSGGLVTTTTSLSSEATYELRKLLYNFYSKHNQKNVELVDQIMFEYNNNEKELFRKIKERYSDEMSSVELLQIDSFVETHLDYNNNRRNGTLSLRLSPRSSDMRSTPGGFRDLDNRESQSNNNNNNNNMKKQHSPPRVPELKLGPLSSKISNIQNPAYVSDSPQVSPKNDNNSSNKTLTKTPPQGTTATTAATATGSNNDKPPPVPPKERSQRALGDNNTNNNNKSIPSRPRVSDEIEAGAGGCKCIIS